MIKVNLLPVKKKKKAKPIPAFLISTIVITAVVGLIMLYLVYFFSSRVSAREAQVNNNEKKIQELKEKIKAVEDYEKRNAAFKQKKEIIEQLSKNRAVPVKILDGASALLPAGVWINGMDFKGSDINLSCTGFTNTDVVNYINNLKTSNLFAEVYLLESVQDQIAGVSVYKFKVSFKVKT